MCFFCARDSREEVRQLKSELEHLESRRKALDIRNDELIQQTKNTASECDLKIKLKDAEVVAEVAQKTNGVRVENENLRIENAKLKSENAILTKAFENMGFDVKDMKEMFTKLVEGISQKNTVQVIK